MSIDMEPFGAPYIEAGPAERPREKPTAPGEVPPPGESVPLEPQENPKTPPVKAPDYPPGHPDHGKPQPVTETDSIRDDIIMHQTDRGYLTRRLGEIEADIKQRVNAVDTKLADQRADIRAKYDLLAEQEIATLRVSANKTKTLIRGKGNKVVSAYKQALKRIEKSANLMASESLGGSDYPDMSMDKIFEGSDTVDNTVSY